MNKLDSIKQKINSLLQKTTENGSSEAEMFSALKKAEELMRKYSINKTELEDAESKKREKCILESTSKFKSSYRTTAFLNSLSNLFDCEYYYTKHEMYFFGYKEDVKLCIYFYNLILKVCFKEKDMFLKSKEGKSLKVVYHSRTISSNFIKGFLNRVSERLNVMYKEKKEESNKKERGLLVIKKTNVEEEFKRLNLPIEVVTIKEYITDDLSFSAGTEKGNSMPLYQGLAGDETTNKLNKQLII